MSDPQAAWEDFLEHGEIEKIAPTYELLATLKYNNSSVEAAACVEHAKALQAAIAAVPVGIAIRRAAMLCAEATGDDAAAERELEALAALSKLALTGGEGVWEKPIRVLRLEDIYSLLAGSGLEYQYEYYGVLYATAHFPLVVAAWDEQAKVERHLAFDYLESIYRLDKTGDMAGFPIRRRWLVDGIIKGHAEAKELAAIDVDAARTASQTADVEAKIAKLRPAAELGGVQSLQAWLLLCTRQAPAGCADGLVDALLPQAESQHALPMALLAFAYGEGIGLARDEQAAGELLDAASRRWHRQGATAHYAAMWSIVHPQGAWPPALQQRLEQAVAQGNTVAEALLVVRKLVAKDKPALTASEVSFLSNPATNQTGMGYELLAEHYEGLQRTTDAAIWRERAVKAGNPEGQARYGFSLLARAHDAATKAEALRWMEPAAQGGNVRAMRQMAHSARMQGQWADAEAWLLDAVAGGDVDAALEISALREWERPGLRVKPEQAVATYRVLADERDLAEARRRLASMAIEGRGMKKDLSQAKQWLLLDAERGNHDAEVSLGMGYLRGSFGKIDEDEGLRWIGKALAAKDAGAYVAYGAWLYYTKNTPDSRLQAMESWLKGEAVGDDIARNNLAWAWCTASDDRIFDPARGIAMAQKMMQSAGLPAGELDTVAACHAAAGDFEQAIAVQQRAADMLRPLGADEQETIKVFDARIALYRGKKRYVELDKD